ncbi:hypothetical protein [Flavobacterium sp. GNP002]
MTKIILKAIFIFSLLFSFNETQAQVSVSYFGNSTNTKIGVGYDFNEKLWTELRIYSGTSLANTTAEAVLNYNFLRKEKFRTYVGGGIVVNNLNGIVVPVGVQFTPFENLNNFSFHIELQLMYEVDYEDMFVNGFGGIRYKFN